MKYYNARWIPLKRWNCIPVSLKSIHTQQYLSCYQKKKKTHTHTTFRAPTADVGYVPNIAFGTYPTPNTIWPYLSNVLNAIFFAICYSIVTNLPRYGKLWHMNLLIFYSSFSLISLSSSPSTIQYSPPPSPLSHTLSSSLFPFALFSSHSWIWATTDFLSTITDL